VTFPLGLLMIGIGACLLFVASRGVETASGSGIYQSLIDGMRGTGSRTESGTNVVGDTGERPTVDDDGMSGLQGLEM
jgi:hypothetical protein